MCLQCVIKDFSVGVTPPTGRLYPTLTIMVSDYPYRAGDRNTSGNLSKRGVCMVKPRYIKNRNNVIRYMSRE